jgi:hypothetical protein
MLGWLKSRKFFIAIYFGTAAFVFCWFGKMSGGECVMLATACAGLYKAANVADGYFSQRDTTVMTRAIPDDPDDYRVQK